MKTAAIYTYYSMQGSLLGQSILQQLKFCTQYAKLKDLEVVQTFIDCTSRAQLKKMLRAARKHEWDCVIVYKLNRITRKTKLFEKIIEKFRKADVTVLSATENFGGTNS